MTKYTLSVGSWTKIASAGSTVEVQGQYVFLTQSATVPTSSTDAETLYGSDDYRKYDAPLPLDLYASFSYSGPSSSTLTGSVEVLPIGAAGGGTVQDTAADTALGTPADQPPATPSTSGSVIAKLGGIWTALLGTLKVQVQNTSVPVTGTFYQATQPISAPDGGLVTLGTTTDAASASGATTTVIGALRAIRDKLLGSIAVTGSFYQPTQPVSGTFWQAIQPVTDAASEAALGTAADAAVSSGNGSIIAQLKGILAKLTSGIAVTGTFYQTTQPVSGTVTANLGTLNGAAQDGTDITGAAMPAGGVGIRGWLSAIYAKLGGVVLAAGTAVIGKVGIQVGGADVATGNPVPVSGSFYQATQPISGSVNVSNLPATQPVAQADVRASGQPLAAATANAAITAALQNGEGTVGWTLVGLTASGATLTAEGSNDGGTTWSAINTIVPGTGALSTTIAADGNYRINGGGHTHVRLRVSTVGTGSITVSYSASSVGSLVGLSASLPGGTNIVGSVQGRTSNPSSTLAVTASSAYAAGNVVGGLLTFAYATDAAMSGILQSIRITSKSVQTAGLKLYLFNALPTTTFADKTAPSIAAADIPKLIDVLTPGTTDSGLGTLTLYTLDGIGKAFVAASTTLYGVLVTTGTPTFASTSDISVYLDVLKD